METRKLIIQIHFLLVLIQISGAIVFADSKKQIVARGDYLVQTPFGDLVVKDLELTKTGRASFKVSGSIENPTASELRVVTLTIDAFGEHGEPLTCSESCDFGLRRLPPGSVQSLTEDNSGDPVDGKEIYFSSEKKIRTISRVAFRVAKAWCPVEYEFSIVEADGAKTLEDDAVEITVDATVFELSLAIRNKTRTPIKIDWNSVSYIDLSGEAHRVTHSGVKHVDKEGVLPPTVIPPLARKVEAVLPTDYVRYRRMSGIPGVVADSGFWDKDPLLPHGFQLPSFVEEARSILGLKGQKIALYLPLEIGTERADYTISLRIEGTRSACLDAALGVLEEQLESERRLGQLDGPPRLIYKVPPVYPPLARHAGIQDAVLFSAVINERGMIENLTLTSGHPLLVPAATAAVKQWRYSPAHRNGRVVESKILIEVPFRLD